MLRYTPRWDRLNPAVIAALAGVLLATFFLIVWAANVVMALPDTARPPAAFKTSLARLAEWVKDTGKDTVMRAAVVQKLGFENRDLAVRERGFKTTDETLTHVCSVPVETSSPRDIIFVALVDERTGDAVIWRADYAGDLVSTARFSDGEATAVSSQATEALFAAEKTYLARQMQREAFRNSPATAPSATPTEPRKREQKEASIPKKFRRSALPQEMMILLINPWVLPGLALIFAIAVFNPHRR